MALEKDGQIIVVKKIKKGGHGHHGGAWKVAYADFVTAMMAFFLLMWLLNVTTEEQRQGIADYFTPTTATLSGHSGAGDVLGGKTITVPGSNVSESSPFAIAPASPTDGVTRDDSDQNNEGRPDEEGTVSDRSDKGQENYERPLPLEQENYQPEANPAAPEVPTEQQIEEALREKEERLFKEVAEELKQAIKAVPELKELQDMLLIDQTPEGLRIQLVDKDGYSMFPMGSAAMDERTHQLLTLVSKAISSLPNKLSISGHTDATPYVNPSGNYTNWELSSDRANAARRIIKNSGVDPERLATVVGRADREPLIKEDPKDPRNRRLSIILLREVPLPGYSGNIPNSYKHHIRKDDGGEALVAPQSMPTVPESLTDGSLDDRSSIP